jgi:hypothetical protein
VSIASSESIRRLRKKFDKCDWPKPVCLASKLTLSEPRSILRRSSRRSRSCIWVKFICGSFATSHDKAAVPFAHGKAICLDWLTFSTFAPLVERVST